MPQEPLLKIDSINSFYGCFQALWEVSLEIRPMEIVALIGANGSGKSTLLDAISGVLPPASGSIEFEGRPIHHMDPYQTVSLGISQVPEGRRVFPDLTVMDNLLLGAYSRRARPNIRKNLEIVYELFPRLEARTTQLAKTLSGGEQQMLALGRGLMSDPKLMLLDEMSLGLAPIVIKDVYAALRKIRDKGITILLVEQNVKRSLAEADRAYIMEAGRVVLNGPARELAVDENIKEAYFGI
jgi:branched-chain amino acid transport system ATP-binding protein